ncbi:peptidylprolyl isomerase [Cohnella kolymensis]|uniref:Peptidyl-prolyl cis-trans isomerase n=1 Tax=Cohnella kolymensis TaxID=1590652 RepID=A0ABR5A987_9BACL|nr:peptidylprolyl isomerase [Cohnella kolymensis]KIL37562.1 peptidylprolyl isomerase [Cohnella kolymensis]
MNARRKLSVLLVFILAVAVVATGCGKRETTPNGNGATASSEAPAAGESTAPASSEAPAASEDPLHKEDNPMVTIEMDNGKKITVELYPEIAPNTVNNFISLAKKGFYDGTIFHRVIPGFMVQGGDPEGTGMGGPGYSIPGEFSGNRFKNDLKHTRGVLSMARTQDPNSAGSQFFIMVADSPHLDAKYAGFGKVTDGMETVDEIVNQPTGAQDRPKNPMAIKKMTVDTKGVEYKEPEKVK